MGKASFGCCVPLAKDEENYSAAFSGRSLGDIY